MHGTTALVRIHSFLHSITAHSVIRKPDPYTYPQERAELAEAEAEELRQSVEKEASASNTKMGTLSQMVEELRNTSNLKKELSMYKLQSGKLISQLEQQCDR